jgi:hypothetical protein
VASSTSPSPRSATPSVSGSTVGVPSSSHI